MTFILQDPLDLPRGLKFIQPVVDGVDVKLEVPSDEDRFWKLLVRPVPHLDEVEDLSG